MDRYTISGFWADGDLTTDTGNTKDEIVSIVQDCLGDGCLGFEIALEEN